MQSVEESHLKRRLFTSVFAQTVVTTILSAAGTHAVAQTSQSPGYASIPGWDGDVFRAIENMPWAAAPGRAEHPVYVVYAPWCPHCRTLAKAVVDGEGREVQTRWIAGRARTRQEVQHVAEVARTRDFGLVAKHMLSQQPSSDEIVGEYVRRCNLIGTAVAMLLKQRGQPSGVPTILFASSGRLAVSAGYGKDFGRHWAARRPRGETARSAANEYLTDTWSAERDLGGQLLLANSDTAVRLFPHDQALPMMILDTGRSLPAQRLLKVRGQNWVEVAFVKGGPPGYIRMA